MGHPPLQLVNLSLGDPARDLALEDLWYQEIENGGNEERLRFWTNTSPCVVLGYGNRVAVETQVEACDRDGIPILRRISGGGTVLLGPGALHYALVVRLERHAEWETVAGANRHIMHRNAQALSQLLDAQVEVLGVTDLAVEGWKCSGNAQKRGRRAMLFHGSILLEGFDIGIVNRYLRHPSREPEYRAGRGHQAFLRPLPLQTDQVMEALAGAWQAKETVSSGAPVPAGLDDLVARHYGNPDWCRRR